jgi:transcriptional regulator GlxA family with amidase domain
MRRDKLAAAQAQMRSRAIRPVAGGSVPGGPSYSVAEVAEIIGFSRRTVVRLFEREPGVLFSSKAMKGKRRTMRIPLAVYHRVIGRLTAH